MNNINNNILPDDFNWKKYINLYEDLKNNILNEKDAIHHYLTYGINESRNYKSILPNDFNWKEYINLYDDLKNNILNEKDAIHHYLTYGINESRNYKSILPNDFKEYDYKFLNHDLKNLNNHEIINHYLMYGINENRIYKINLPENFDLYFYKTYYEDLKCLNDSELVKHYLNYGINEGRIYNDYIYLNFDWIKYINDYDNVNQYNYNRIKVFKHFNDNSILNKKTYYFNYLVNDCNILNEDYYNTILNNKIENIKNFNKYSFIIVTNKYGLSIANNLKLLFDKLNIESKIIYDLTNEEIENNKMKENEFFFILFHSLYNELPKNKYIIYQLEQITQSNFIDNNFIQNIKNSFITFDYSLFNIYNFNKYNDSILNYKLLYLPLSINNINYTDNNNIEYDIIFFGSKNYRREKILNNILSKYKIKIIYDIFGDELMNLIKKSRIILNIHYYKNANLEVSRINEILEYNKLIISELPHINDNNINLYKNNIIFINEIEDDLSNIGILYNMLDYYLDINNYNNYLKNNTLFINKIFNNSLYYLEKNINLINKINIKEIAVVSCNYGNYDINEIDINILNNNNIFDWYYFTDSNINLNKWNIINHDYHSNNIKNIHNNDINRMISKYYKFQSLNIDILQSYKYIIWMDTAIIIENKNFVNDIINLLISNNNEIFIFEHYRRDNIKDEFLASMNLYKYKNQNMTKQVKEYLKSGMIDNKLYETGFIIYKNSKSIKKLMNNWWNEINLYSYQCQISAPYVFYKNNINPYILNEYNFKKLSLEGSVWRNNLYGHVKFSHVNNNNISKTINYNKINGIDHILWINLNKSLDRQKYMTELLENINIPNTRINAINYKNNDVRNIISNVQLERDLSNYDIARTLSHIKAINYIKNIDSNYFLILEDDITFDNINIFEEDLNDIIKKSPDFDILILSKTYIGNIDNIYVKWIDYYKTYTWIDNYKTFKELNFIDGVVSYVISKKNILCKLDNLPKYVNDNFFEMLFNNKFDISELYIFKFFNTIVYKYNYISILLDIDNHKDLHNINYVKQLNIIKNEYFI